MTKQDKKWNMSYDKLVEFKRTNGHCMVPRRYEQDTSLGCWVHTQRNMHKEDKIRIDRKIILDEIGFTWKDEGAQHNYDDKLWHHQYEKLVDFKRINGSCNVPRNYDEDKSLGTWVSHQRHFRNKNKMRPDRKDLLDEIGFAWKHYTLAACSSPNDVRGPVTGSFWPDHVSHSSYSCSAYLCRIRSRKRSPGPAVWVPSQTKHDPPKDRNHNKATLEIIVQFPTERDHQVPALPKQDEWPLVQNKEAMLQAVVRVL
jgi:hypothetical protein